MSLDPFVIGLTLFDESVDLFGERIAYFDAILLIQFRHVEAMGQALEVVDEVSVAEAHASTLWIDHLFATVELLDQLHAEHVLNHDLVRGRVRAWIEFVLKRLRGSLSQMRLLLQLDANIAVVVDLGHHVDVLEHALDCFLE